MKRLFLLVCCGFLNYAHATQDCRATSLYWASDFNKFIQQDEFIVYYTDQPNSKNYIQNQTDLNNNHIPDYVENILIQAIAARDAYTLARLRPPLESPRYKNKTGSIAIFVKDIPGNGVAFEEPSRFTNVAAGKMPCSVIIYISNKFPVFPGNYFAVVSHELFHLYQYSYAQFKNSWYLESLAKWAEQSLRLSPKIISNENWLYPITEFEWENQVFSKSYNNLFRYLFLKNKNDMLVFPESFTQRRYIDGSLVFKDKYWPGGKAIVRLLDDLQKQSNHISKLNHWDKYNWEEKNQRLVDWNAIIKSSILNNIKADDLQDH